MMKKFIGITILLLTFYHAGPALAARQIVSHKVDTAPVLDGKDNDIAWQNIKPDVIYDKTSGSNFFLKSVHTDDKIYFCVQYNDTAENSFHKPWIWNQALNRYITGPHREDTFVFKWSMMDKPVDLSNFSEDLYTADIWYWKANRTNLAGHADDKHQVFSDTTGQDATETVTTSGKKRYLYRISDAGKPAYEEIKTAPAEMSTQIFNRYEPRKPSGSRGDVKAKGTWNHGFWIIEFARHFDTGNGKAYQFGVSIFSLYGRPLTMDQPNRYGMGQISEPLELVFKP